MSPTTNHQEIDDALLGWRQGDAVVEKVPFFLHLADTRSPLTPASNAVATGDDADGLAGSERHITEIIAIPSGGTAIVLGNTDTFDNEIFGALGIAGVERDEIDITAALERRATEVRDAGLQAEAGIRSGGIPVHLSSYTETLRSGRKMRRDVVVGTLRGLDCLMIIVSAGNQTFCVATQAEYETLANMLRGA